MGRGLRRVAALGRRGVALVLTLAFMLLLASVCVVLMFRAASHRQQQAGSSMRVTADSLGEAAVSAIVADLRAETRVNSEETVFADATGGESLYLKPSSKLTLGQRREWMLPGKAFVGRTDFSVVTVPATANLPGAEPLNLVKQTRSGASLYDATGISSSMASVPLVIGSAVSSSAPSRDGSYVSSATWDKPRLLAGRNQSFLDILKSGTEQMIRQALVDGQSGGTFAMDFPEDGALSPDWVMLTPSGIAELRGFSTELADPASRQFVVGRFAANIYDVSGLLDINAMGDPGTPGVRVPVGQSEGPFGTPVIPTTASGTVSLSLEAENVRGAYAGTLMGRPIGPYVQSGFTGSRTLKESFLQYASEALPRTAQGNGLTASEAWTVAQTLLMTKYPNAFHSDVARRFRNVGNQWKYFYSQSAFLSPGFLYDANGALVNLGSADHLGGDGWFSSRGELVRAFEGGLGLKPDAATVMKLRRVLPFLSTFGRDGTTPEVLRKEIMTWQEAIGRMTAVQKSRSVVYPFGEHWDPNWLDAKSSDPTKRWGLIPSEVTGFNDMKYPQTRFASFNGNDKTLMYSSGQETALIASQKLLNPDLGTVRVTGTTPRYGVTATDPMQRLPDAKQGEPLVKHRFSLTRLDLFEKYWSSGRSKVYEDAIRYYFGLKWETVGPNEGIKVINSPEGSADYRFGCWVYQDGNLADGRILTLADVAKLGREPNFFEMLQSAVVAGSLGRVMTDLGLNSMQSDDYVPPERRQGGPVMRALEQEFGSGLSPIMNTEWEDPSFLNSARFLQSGRGGVGVSSNPGVDSIDYFISTDNQIFKMAANIIDQWDADSFPTVLARPFSVKGTGARNMTAVGTTGGGGGSRWADLAFGNENLPLIYGLGFSAATYDNDGKDLYWDWALPWKPGFSVRLYAFPMLWNPNQFQRRTAAEVAALPDMRVLTQIGNNPNSNNKFFRLSVETICRSVASIQDGDANRVAGGGAAGWSEGSPWVYKDTSGFADFASDAVSAFSRPANTTGYLTPPAPGVNLTDLGWWTSGWYPAAFGFGQLPGNLGGFSDIGLAEQRLSMWTRSGSNNGINTGIQVFKADFSENAEVIGKYVNFDFNKAIPSFKEPLISPLARRFLPAGTPSNAQYLSSTRLVFGESLPKGSGWRVRAPGEAVVKEGEPFYDVRLISMVDKTKDYSEPDAVFLSPFDQYKGTGGRMAAAKLLLEKLTQESAIVRAAEQKLTPLTGGALAFQMDRIEDKTMRLILPLLRKDANGHLMMHPKRKRPMLSEEMVAPDKDKSGILIGNVGYNPNGGGYYRDPDSGAFYKDATGAELFFGPEYNVIAPFKRVTLKFDPRIIEQMFQRDLEYPGYQMELQYRNQLGEWVPYQRMRPTRGPRLEWVKFTHTNGGSTDKLDWPRGYVKFDPRSDASSPRSRELAQPTSFTTLRRTAVPFPPRNGYNPSAPPNPNISQTVANYNQLRLAWYSAYDMTGPPDDDFGLDVWRDDWGRDPRDDRFRLSAAMARIPGSPYFLYTSRAMPELSGLGPATYNVNNRAEWLSTMGWNEWFRREWWMGWSPNNTNYILSMYNINIGPFPEVRPPIYKTQLPTMTDPGGHPLGYAPGKAYDWPHNFFRWEHQSYFLPLTGFPSAQLSRNDVVPFNNQLEGGRLMKVLSITPPSIEVYDPKIVDQPTNAGKVVWRVFYRDPDGVVRPSDGYLQRWTYDDTEFVGQPLQQRVDISALHSVATPTVDGRLAGADNTRWKVNAARPAVLNRPFRSVAEMGYAFRGGMDWKSIDFSSDRSGDAALLEVFSLEEPVFSPQTAQVGVPKTGEIRSMVDRVVRGGKVNLNSPHPIVLAQLFRDFPKDFTSDPANALWNISTDDKGTRFTDSQAVNLALNMAVVTQADWDATARPWAGPLTSQEDLLERFVGNYKTARVYAKPTVQELQAGASWNADVRGIPGDFYYDNSIAGSPVTLRDGLLKSRREAVTRALTGQGSLRTWNYMIDVVVQSGRYGPGAKNLADFSVGGQSRFWVHVSIDRTSGRILETHWESVKE